jgi:hypothetical protein
VPKQNRVNPFGEIIATRERGTFMGNRGVLHDADGRIRRPWQVKRWLLCVLEFRARKRTVMKPDWYTELFFLDEATGLAAGHRPCFECRRERFNAFRDAWLVANGSKNATAATIDERLHAERVAPDCAKRTFRANLDGLPNGVFVVLPSAGEVAHLVWDDRLLAWSPGGYQKPRSRPKDIEVDVLTPASAVGALRAGYVPEIHESAGLRQRQI